MNVLPKTPNCFLLRYSLGSGVRCSAALRAVDSALNLMRHGNSHIPSSKPTFATDAMDSHQEGSEAPHRAKAYKTEKHRRKKRKKKKKGNLRQTYQTLIRCLLWSSTGPPPLIKKTRHYYYCRRTYIPSFRAGRGSLFVGRHRPEISPRLSIGGLPADKGTSRPGFEYSAVLKFPYEGIFGGK